MKRFVVFLLVLCLSVSLCSAAFAENEKTEAPEQIAYGLVEEQMSGETVLVTLDLKDNWSAGFYPAAFYLFDSAEAAAKDEFTAFGTVMTEEDYAGLLEAEEDSEREDKDGYTVFTEENAVVFVAQIKPAEEDEQDKKDKDDKDDPEEPEEPENLYVVLRVYDSALAEDAWSRVAYELAGINMKGPSQLASGVLMDASNEDVFVQVDIDVTEGWSALFLPMAFYLYNEDTPEDDFEIYGTILNKEEYDDLVKTHTEDKNLEEKDGYLMYIDEDYSGILASVDEEAGEYITLIAYKPIDVEAVWALISYEMY